MQMTTQQATFHSVCSDTIDTRELILQWVDVDPVIVNEDLELPQFDLLNISTIPCGDQGYNSGTVVNDGSIFILLHI